MRFSAVKFVNHADDHPEDPLLRVRRLPVEGVKDLYERIRSKLGKEPRTSPRVLLSTLEEMLMVVPGANAETDGFNPLAILPPGIADIGDSVFLNFGEPEEIWRMSSVDLARYFDSIWYSGPDDLMLLEENLAWVVGISNTGTVRSLRL